MCDPRFGPYISARVCLRSLNTVRIVKLSSVCSRFLVFRIDLLGQ
jgi:hypothetical protein